MGDMLSQAEIDALLGGPSSEPEADGAGDSAQAPSTDYSASGARMGVSSAVQTLTSEQKDILGEIGNISMGTAATTLFTLLNQKVWITTPEVMEITWDEFKNMHDRPCVGIRVGYKEGLVGSNVLILKERDVKIIANLMMGGDGTGPSIDEELNEIDLSAIGEAMNQMVGSSSTSLSSLTKMKIDIDTPFAFRVNFDDNTFFDDIGFKESDNDIVAISFKMEVGALIDSQIMQLIPTPFAIGMVDALKNEMGYSTPPEASAPAAAPPPQAPQQQMQQQPQMQQQQPMMQQQQPMMQQPMQQQGMMPQYQQPMYDQSGYGMQMQQPMYQQPPMPQAPQGVAVQPAQFQNFDYSSINQQKENIGIIMDVPLEVTVELGRTTRLIRDILEFGPGTIVELNKLAGEPIDIYVNSKYVAKGEVVVIDENFGVRITDIVSVENRI